MRSTSRNFLEQLDGQHTLHAVLDALQELRVLLDRLPGGGANDSGVRVLADLAAHGFLAVLEDSDRSELALSVKRLVPARTILLLAA